MAFTVTVPRLGWDMEEAVFVEWLKKEGASVKEGEPLFVIEGDKAVQEVEAIDSGILRIPPDGPKQGQTVKVGAVLGYLVASGEKAPFEGAAASSSAETHRSSDAAAAVVKAKASDDAGVKAVRVAAASGEVAEGPRISPRAARVAAELGVDWTQLKGSGRTGRIREEDVRAAAAAKPARPAAPPTAAARAPVDVGASGKVIPMSPIRKRIADRMAGSAHTTAPVTLTTTADMTRLVAFRAGLKKTYQASGQRVPGPTDLIIKLTAMVLRDHPMLYARWGEDKLIAPEQIDIGMAVDTEAGLLVPVIRNVPSLSIPELARRSGDLIERARSRRLTPDEMQGGVFTVTNLGTFGVEGFTPIINLPECAVLGVGRIVRRPAMVGDRIEPRDEIVLSLTFDHRIVDGGPAARFLDAVRQTVESPEALLGVSEGVAPIMEAAAPSTRRPIPASGDGPDAVIIGAGPGGYVAALRIAAMGGKAVLIEQNCVGGVCLNTGCIPTKALLHVSKIRHELSSMASMGLKVGQTTVDFPEVFAHKDKIVDRLTKGLGTLLQGRGVRVISGRGRLVDPRTAEVESAGGTERVTARNVILATGTVPAPLPGIDIDGTQVMNTDQVLAMQAMPASFLIIGGGPIGVEFATMLAEFGSRVTLVEVMDRILPTVDAEAAKEVAKSLKKRKITLFCGTKVESVERHPDHVTSRLSNGQAIETAAVVVAIGRRTQIAGLGLDEAGVKHDGRYVAIDDRCLTNVAGVYAIGDITGKGPYAHVAYRQGIVAASNIMGIPMTEDYRVVPTVVFSHPELAQVGLGEEAARKAGMSVEVGRFRYQASGAAQAYGEPEGVCTLVAQSGTRRILGATIVGHRSAEVIHEVAVALKAGLTVEQVAETIHAHPSLAEPVFEAADALMGLALHSL